MSKVFIFIFMFAIAQTHCLQEAENPEPPPSKKADAEKSKNSKKKKKKKQDDDEEDEESKDSDDKDSLSLGAQIYEENCAACHGDLEDSEIADKDADEIDEAESISSHGGIKSWPDADETEELVKALSGEEGDEGGALSLGAKVYKEKCAMCHGELAESKKAGRDADAILDAEDISQHGGVDPWPDADEAEALEEALAE